MHLCAVHLFLLVIICTCKQMTDIFRCICTSRHGFHAEIRILLGTVWQESYIIIFRAITCWNASTAVIHHHPMSQNVCPGIGPHNFKTNLK